MALSAGTKLGVYEIVAPIGSGGHGRELSRDSERLARLEREAKLCGR